MNPQSNLRELGTQFEGRVQYDDTRVPGNDTRHFDKPISLDTHMFQNTRRLEGE